MSKELAFSEDDLIQSITRESFYEFLIEFWDIVISEDPSLNWHIEYLCGVLQKEAERVFDKKEKKEDIVINISPGTTKSTICSIMYPAWVWTRMPSARFICGSFTNTLALELSRKCRDIVMSDKYQRVFYDIKLRDDQNTKGLFSNTEKGSRLAVGSGGMITGHHAHFIIIDDPVDPKGAVSELEMKSVNDWMNETLPTRKVDKRITSTILIQQRLHQNDQSAMMIKRGGVRHICIPAEYTGTEVVKPSLLKKKYKNGLMDPERLSKKVMEEAELSLGEYGYAGQFLQHPIPRGGGMFKTERIIIDTPPISWKRKVRYWDKAGTKEGKGAYTVGALLGKDLSDRFWVLNIVRGRWESYARESIIKQTAEIDGKSVVVGIEQEPGSGGKESAQNTIRNLAGFRVRADCPTGDKAQRADPFSTQVNAGNVRMARGPWIDEYLEELRYFPYSKHKDQVDASSGAFNRITGMKSQAGGLPVCY